jgi:hypothetical protein
MAVVSKNKPIPINELAKEDVLEDDNAVADSDIPDLADKFSNRPQNGNGNPMQSITKEWSAEFEDVFLMLPEG